MAILKFATPIWRRSPCRLALASAGMGSLSGISGFGQCTSRRSTKSTPRVLRLWSTERAKSPARRYSCDTLVVRKISSRRTPEARMPSPTPRSVPYFQAVSSAPCAESVGIEGEAIDGYIRTIGERTLRSACAGSIALARQDVTPPRAPRSLISVVSVEVEHELPAPSQTKTPPCQAGFGIVRV